jgi:uncharacterized membrane protein YbhN (UPF0104 family)
VTAADSSVPATPRRRRALAVRIVGLSVAALAIALCAKALADSWPEVRSSLVHASIAWLVVGLVASAAAMLGLALLWWRSLHLFGSPAGARAAVAWYFGGELGKYLPGGVWTVLGRGELAQRGGRVTRTTAYATTLICYGVMCAGAFAVCAVLAPSAALFGHGGTWGWALLLLVPVAAAMVHPAVLGPILVLARRVTGGRIDLRPQPWSAMLGLVGWSAPSWLFLGAGAISVTEALGYDQNIPQVAFAAVAAWIVGFVAVPVPAGAGVREVLFIALCGLAAAPAALVAVLMRVLLIVVDGVAGGVGLAYSAREARRRPVVTEQ